MFSVSSRDPLQQGIFFTAHLTGLSGAAFVIIPDQMEQAVNEQSLNLAAERVAKLPRLSRRNGDGNDDIPQQVRLNLPELSLSERKGEHVGGPVDSAITAVEGAHGAVTGEQDAQLCLRKTETQ